MYASSSNVLIIEMMLLISIMLDNDWEEGGEDNDRETRSNLKRIKTHRFTPLNDLPVGTHSVGVPSQKGN